LPSIAEDVKVFHEDPDDGQWREVEVLYADAAPGLTAGVMQVNFRLPLDLAISRNEILPNLVERKWGAVTFRGSD